MALANIDYKVGEVVGSQVFKKQFDMIHDIRVIAHGGSQTIL